MFPSSREILPDDKNMNSGHVVRVERARMALLLHKLPSEIDAMPWQDYSDLIAVLEADDKLAKAKVKT